MPKIRDLGIKVIPETMRPPEIGGGGGCTDCTVVQFSICGTTPNRGGGGCTDCTAVPYSICGTTPGAGGGCTDCTFQQFSICGTTPGGGGGACTDCTAIPFSICGTTQCGFITHRGCGHPWTFCGCTIRQSVVCGASVACGPQSLPCGAFTNCGAISPVCGGSIVDPTIVQQQPGLTREQIASIKESLKAQITALEEHEKTIGPKTAAEIETREKQLNAELAQLAARKKDLKK